MVIADGCERKVGPMAAGRSGSNGSVGSASHATTSFRTRQRTVSKYRHLRGMVTVKVDPAILRAAYPSKGSDLHEQAVLAAVRADQQERYDAKPGESYPRPDTTVRNGARYQTAIPKGRQESPQETRDRLARANRADLSK